MEHKATLEDKPLIAFIDNPALKGREVNFTTVNISVKALLWDWKSSLFAHEWLNRDGTLKKDTELSESNREKKHAVALLLQKGETLSKPVLGIGIMENIEIGAGKDIVMAMAEAGILTIPAHIPKHETDAFQSILG